MDRVHRRIGTPVLTGLRLESAGLHIDEGSLVQERLPDLFTGTPLVVTVHIKARYRPQVVAELAALGLPNVVVGEFGIEYDF